MTFLALPQLVGVVAVYGAGVRVLALARALAEAGVPSLSANSRIVYWGDADSYGYEILDGIRSYLPDVSSVLMDVQTVRMYRDLAVEEPVSSRFVPTRLEPEEVAGLEYLRDNSQSGCLRIEQERLSFDYVVEVLRTEVERRA